MGTTEEDQRVKMASKNKLEPLAFNLKATGKNV